MSRPTTFWEDLGIGVLAGAIIVLTATAWTLVASERGGSERRRLNDSLSEDSMPRFVPRTGR